MSKTKTKKPNKLSVFLATKTGRTLFHVTYSVGAAIVILGALAKINHFPLGYELLTIGMVTEAFVFFISAFDTDQVDHEDAGSGVTVIGGTSTGIAGTSTTSSAIQTHPGVKTTGTGGTTIIGGGGGVIGGGTTVVGGSQGTGSSVAAVQGGGTTVVGGGISGAGVAGGGTTVVGGGTGGGVVSGGGVVGGTVVSGGVSGTGVSGGTAGAGGGIVGGGVSSFDTNNFSPEYIAQMDNMAKEMQSFSTVMSSFMAGYDPSTAGQDAAKVGFFENMKVLNDNVININKVYEDQLKSVGNQISTIRYINESLERIRSLYDNTVLDSNAFKMENEKMTRQIQELNKVYARLLHAMNAGGGYNPAGGGGYNPSI